MRNVVIILTILSILFCVSCRESDTPDTTNDHDESSICSSMTINSIDELANYMIENKDGSLKAAFEHPAQINNKLTIYSPANIPSGYNLSEIRIRDYSSYISMDYVCDDSENGKSKITFVWGFETDGDKFLSQAINMMELSPMPGMPGYYYIGVTDDYGVEIYQIYWSEDGYYMQANIPTHLIGESESNDIAVLTGDNTSDESQMKLTLKKTDYPIN